MAFLKTILIILLGYYLLKILARLLAPKLINYAAKKTESRFKEAFEGFEQQANSYKKDDGDVIINKKSTTKKRDSEKVGEYIDFEELD